jgi:hypothetical protein
MATLWAGKDGLPVPGAGTGHWRAWRLLQAWMRSEGAAIHGTVRRTGASVLVERALDGLPFLPSPVAPASPDLYAIRVDRLGWATCPPEAVAATTSGALAEAPPVDTIVLGTFDAWACLGPEVRWLDLALFATDEDGLIYPIPSWLEAGSDGRARLCVDAEVAAAHWPARGALHGISAALGRVDLACWLATRQGLGAFVTVGVLMWPARDAG